MDEKSTETPAILAPLLLFLSARDGLHSPSSTSRPALPRNALNEHTIQYRGNSHVEYICRSPRCKRWVCAIGDTPRSGQYVLIFRCALRLLTIPTARILSVVLAYYGADFIINIIYGRSSPWLQFAPFVILALIPLLFLCTGIYSRRQRRRDTPAEFDPSSYQYRLVAALRASGIEYSEVSVSLDELERQMKKQEGPRLKERFVIHDLEGQDGKCDVLVRFHGNGQVVLAVADKEEKKPELIISHAV